MLHEEQMAQMYRSEAAKSDEMANAPDEYWHGRNATIHQATVASATCSKHDEGAFRHGLDTTPAGDPSCKSCQRAKARAAEQTPQNVKSPDQWREMHRGISQSHRNEASRLDGIARTKRGMAN